MKNRIIIISLISLILLVGCELRKNSITSTDFNKVLIDKDYILTNVSKNFKDYENVNEAFIAQDETKTYQIEFYSFNTKDNTNAKDYKTGSNNNETLFTSNAIKNINNNETNTVNSNTISNNNNIILENELLTVKLSNYYQYKKHKNNRKINLINKNNLISLKPTHSSSVSNIFKNSKIKNLSFRLNKTTKNSNNNNITNKENTNRNKLKKENSFRIKGPNFQKMIGRQYLSKLKYI